MKAENCCRKPLIPGSSPPFGHWHPPSQTIGSFAPGWRSPRGSLKSSSGSAGTVTEEVVIVTGAGSCVASFFSGNMGRHVTDLAVGGEGISPNLRNQGAARHALAVRGRVRGMVKTRGRQSEPNHLSDTRLAVCFLTRYLTDHPRPFPRTLKIENEKKDVCLACVFPYNRLKHYIEYRII